MAFFFLRELLFLSTILLLVPFYLILKSKRKRNNPLLPTDWPIVGMLPALIANRHNFHEFTSAMLAAAGNNFVVRGPPATSIRFFTTIDPENVRHIFETNFDNYPKGEEFAEVFGVLAGTIIAADSDSWRRQRTRIKYVLTRPDILAFMERSCHNKMVDGLVPLLTRMATAGTPFDMQDLLGRLVMDLTVMVVFGDDPRFLSAGMPPMHVASALDTIMQVILHRMIMPVFCWKAMGRRNVGWESRYAMAEAVLRRFTAERIGRRMAGGGDDEASTVSMLTYYLNDPDPEYLDDDGVPTDFLHRSFINFLLALRDPMSSALSWLIYNLATNPHAVAAMREELAPIVALKSGHGIDGGPVIFEPKETKDLVYQRAALFESLRLYPIGPLERKEAAADDVLPSGHKVRCGDTIFVSVYGMGRVESVWGQDCREYRPERWISEEDGGKLRHVLSHKFMAFNTGPRSCLGKKIAVAQITSIVATMIWNFDVEMVPGHAVEPMLSVILVMKNGLMVTVKKTRETTE